MKSARWTPAELAEYRARTLQPENGATVGLKKVSRPKPTKPPESKPDWAIGIDPGTKTGVAVWNVKTQKFHFVFTYTIFEALIFVENWIVKTEGSTLVVIEDARKRFKIPEKDGKPDVSRLQGAGSVKRDSAIWQEACEYWKMNFGAEKFNFKMVAPNGKTNSLAKDKELSSRNLGLTYGTTEHARCAAFLVWKT